MGNNEALTLNFKAPLPQWENKAASAIRSRRRFAIRDYIATLDPVRDCQEISYLLTCYEFPWDTTRSLEFALFRVFGVAKGSRGFCRKDCGKSVRRLFMRSSTTACCRLSA